MTVTPRQTFSITLAGQVVTITAWWQPLSELWYLSVEAVAGASIAAGRQIAPFTRLIRSEAFQGEIVAIPRNANNTAAVGRTAWDDTHDLVYLTAEEAEALGWT